MRQQSFTQFNVSRGHSRLGMDFQADIDEANSAYKSRGLAHVERNPNVWRFTSAKQWMAYPPKMRAKSEHFEAGRTIVRFLVMEKSNIDYTGLARAFSLAFDAKETQEASIPLRMFSDHQITRLVSMERCGARAGFLVRFSRDDSVYWIGASKVREAYDRAMYQLKGKALLPKSLRPEWLAEHGMLIETPRSSMLRVDYLRGIAPELFPVIQRA